MKRNVLLAVFTLLSFNLVAQNMNPGAWCGTKLTENDLNWLRSYQKSRSANQTKSAFAPVWVPVKIHIVGKNDGSGYFSVKEALTDICELNTGADVTGNNRMGYNDFGFNLFQYGDIDFINNTSFYLNGNSSNPSATNAMATHNVPEALNIYFLANDPLLCGYYTPGTDNVVIFGTNCGHPGQTTIPHEVGHYFSLPHTFHGWEGVPYTPCGAKCTAVAQHPSLNNIERVTRSSAGGSLFKNDSTAADGFADTDADYDSGRWACNGGGGSSNPCKEYDPDSIMCHPDETLYMSYADDACVNRFSPEQIKAMQANVDGGPRSFFKLNAPQDKSVITSLPTLQSPANNSTGEPSNYALFTWSKVTGPAVTPDPTKYVVIVYKGSNTSNPVFAKVTQDNFAVAQNVLAPNTLYRWEVSAFTPGKPCGSYTAKFAFTTGDPTGVEQVANDETVMLVSPNPAATGTAINLYVKSNVSERVNASIYSIDGRRVSSEMINLQAGENINSINLNCGSGLYFCKLTGATLNKSVRFEVVNK